MRRLAHHPLVGRLPPIVTILPKRLRRNIVWGAGPDLLPTLEGKILAFVPRGVGQDQERDAPDPPSLAA